MHRIDDPDSPSQLEPYPQPSAADYSAQLVKIGLASVPVFGGPATELFAALTGPLLTRQRDEWFEKIRRRLDDLSRTVQGFTFESLVNNEQFVCALIRATPAALRTNQEVKKEALRNALLNIALGRSRDEDQQAMFLNLVDEFTATHLHVLRLFQTNDGGERGQLAQQQDQDLTDQIVGDLNRAGLVRDPRPYVAQNRPSPMPLVTYRWEITALGNAFLRFISQP